MRKVNNEKYLNEINLKERNFKYELFIDGESRKNSIQIEVIIIENFLLLILIQNFYIFIFMNYLIIRII